MYTESNALIYNRENRPFKTIEQISDKLWNVRAKKFTPPEKEVPEYDPELFEK